MSKSNVKVPIVIAAALLLIVGVCIYYASENRSHIKTFYGPTSMPHVTGPRTLPPAN